MTGRDSDGWVKLLSSRRGDTPGPVAYLKTFEICCPNREQSSDAAVVTVRDSVFSELARKGTRIDGVRFRVEDCWDA